MRTNPQCKGLTGASTLHLFKAWVLASVRRPGSAVAALLLAGCLAGTTARAQTYVTPTLGGGQVAGNMSHIDICYYPAANVLTATIDDTFGTPELRALQPGYAFDPEKPYAVLNGKAYNAEYGWNVGGIYTLPPGGAIWIELLDCTPNLETYSGWRSIDSHTPIFGTDGTPLIWQWGGVMVHNTYAVRDPPIGRLFADYHIYFGDAATGSRDGFTDMDDTFVRLEWTTVPVENPMAFKFGAVGPTNTAPLCFINSAQFITNSLAVVNMRYTNAGPCAFQYECCLPLVAVPASASCGGPATSHAALGSCLELELVPITGPPQASLGCWEPRQAQPCFSLATGEAAGTNRVAVSQTRGTPTADPYGCVAGRHLAVNRPGLYCLAFRVVDTSTNGPAGGPIHAPSPLYQVYLQAGLTVAALLKQGPSTTALFGGEPARTFYLERTLALGPAASWQTVAGPLSGTNRLQTLTDPAATGTKSFFRLRAL